MNISFYLAENCNDFTLHTIEVSEEEAATIENHVKESGAKKATHIHDKYKYIAIGDKHYEMNNADSEILQRLRILFRLGLDASHVSVNPILRINFKAWYEKLPLLSFHTRNKKKEISNCLEVLVDDLNSELEKIPKEIENINFNFDSSSLHGSAKEKHAAIPDMLAAIDRQIDYLEKISNFILRNKTHIDKDQSIKDKYSSLYKKLKELQDHLQDQINQIMNYQYELEAKMSENTIIIRTWYTKEKDEDEKKNSRNFFRWSYHS